MKNVFKSTLYWLSIVCPLIDIVKGIVKGVSAAVDEADYQLEQLKHMRKEEIIAHKSILNERKFDNDNK